MLRTGLLALLLGTSALLLGTSASLLVTSALLAITIKLLLYFYFLCIWADSEEQMWQVASTRLEGELQAVADAQARSIVFLCFLFL